MLNKCTVSNKQMNMTFFPFLRNKISLSLSLSLSHLGLQHPELSFPQDWVLALLSEQVLAAVSHRRPSDSETEKVKGHYSSLLFVYQIIMELFKPFHILTINNESCGKLRYSDFSSVTWHKIGWCNHKLEQRYQFRFICITGITTVSRQLP